MPELASMPPPRRTTAKQDAQRKAAREAAAKERGAEIKASHAAEMAVHLKTFQEQLEVFAATHKKQARHTHPPPTRVITCTPNKPPSRPQIQTDPQFRAQFNRMCREVGVDPLQCASAAALAHTAASPHQCP